MSSTTETTQQITFRRYKDGDNKIGRLNEKIFQASLHAQMPDLYPVDAALPGKLPGG